MPTESLVAGEKWSVRLRQLIVPDWIWQLTWLRHLPACYRSIDWSECPRAKWKVFADLIYIFFHLRTVPEHYAYDRLWEVPRSEWAKYYGTPYPPIQRGRFARRVYPFEYQILYNDKVLGAQLWSAVGVRHPRTLGRIEANEAGWRETIAQMVESAASGRVMLKPVFGRSGIGIVIAQKNSGGSGDVIVHARGGDMPLAKFELHDPVFIQEMIQQHPRIAEIASSSVNTCRVITMLRSGGDVIIVTCAMRFGVGNSYVDNWSAGGVGVGIDHQTGRLRKFGCDLRGHRLTRHPTSGFVFEGFEIPGWTKLIETARRAQRELPFSKMNAFDLCVDHDGEPVLIEINGLGDLTMPEAANGPLLGNREVLEAFAEYELLVSAAQRRLLALMPDAQSKA